MSHEWSSGQNVILPSLVGENRDFVHPDDVESSKSWSGASIHKVCGFEGDYVVLCGRNETIRVKPDNLRSVNHVNRSIDEMVKVKRSNGETQDVTIEQILWHFKKERPFYLVSYQGQKLSRRFFEEDFQ